MPNNLWKKEGVEGVKVGTVVDDVCVVVGVLGAASEMHNLQNQIQMTRTASRLRTGYTRR